MIARLLRLQIVWMRELFLPVLNWRIANSIGQARSDIEYFRYPVRCGNLLSRVYANSLSHNVLKLCIWLLECYVFAEVYNHGPWPWKRHLSVLKCEYFTYSRYSRSNNASVYIFQIVSFGKTHKPSLENIGHNERHSRFVFNFKNAIFSGFKRYFLTVDPTVNCDIVFLLFDLPWVTNL